MTADVTPPPKLVDTVAARMGLIPRRQHGPTGRRYFVVGGNRARDNAIHEIEGRGRTPYLAMLSFEVAIMGDGDCHPFHEISDWPNGGFGDL